VNLFIREVSASYTVEQSGLKKPGLTEMQGLEDSDRLHKYINGFSKRLSQGSNVRVRHILDNRLISYASEFKGSEVSSQTYVFPRVPLSAITDRV